MSVIKMTDLDLAGKRVFIRADLNVPVKDGKVTSDARIRASLPTIELALKQGAKVMVTSHLGRPTEGEYNEEFSLLPVVNYLKATVAIANVVSSIRLAKPHSLSHQTSVLIRCAPLTRVCVPSTMALCGSWLKSVETNGNSV